MTAKLNYEDPRGRGGPSAEPPTERVKNSSRRRILNALEEALNELIMLDEGSRSKD